MEEAENVIAGYPTVKCEVQSNLGYPDIDYPDFSIIRTFSLVPFFSWILMNLDVKNFRRWKNSEIAV